LERFWIKFYATLELISIERGGMIMVAKLPGKSYDEMMALTIKNHGIPYVFSYELLIAIFWEESPFFNNVE